MPDAQFPSQPKGWLIVLLASFVGFLSGFLTIKLMRGWLG